MKSVINPPTGPSDCGRFEQDLLLYIHDALSSTSRMRIEAHIAHCIACQKRIEAFTAVSKTLAESVRGEDMPKWTPRRLPQSIWRRIPWYTPLLVMLFIGGLGVIAFEYGLPAWVAERVGGAPPNNFREKSLTHSRSVSPTPCIERRLR